MPFPTKKFNELVLQLLFSLDMGDSLEVDLIPFLMRELSVTRKTVRAAYQKARTIFESREELNEKIAATSKEYALERIQRVERTVLRLALYEIWHETEMPREMIIAAAQRAFVRGAGCGCRTSSWNSCHIPSRISRLSRTMASAVLSVGGSRSTIACSQDARVTNRELGRPDSLARVSSACSSTHLDPRRHTGT